MNDQFLQGGFKKADLFFFFFLSFLSFPFLTENLDSTQITV